MSATGKRVSVEDDKIKNLLKRFPHLAPEVVIQELENTRGHAGEAARRLKEVSNGVTSPTSGSFEDLSLSTPKPSPTSRALPELSEPQTQKSLDLLRESLLKFRTDIDEHFNARRRHVASRQKLHEFYLRSQKIQVKSYSAARDKLGEAMNNGAAGRPNQVPALQVEMSRALPAEPEEATKSPSEQWSTDWMFHCCKSGEESTFNDKAMLIDPRVASSARVAVEQLNSGRYECTDDVCIVYSAMHGAYFALYRHRKRQIALQRLGIVDRLRGKLSVRIGAGFNLRSTDTGVFGNATDVFVVARIGREEYNTKRISNNLNPTWNSEWFRFQVDTWEPAKQALHLHVFDRMQDRVCLGSCKVDLRKADLASGNVNRRRELLEAGNGGEIEFEMMLEPEKESEEPLREVEKLKRHIGDGVYICILGGTSFAEEDSKAVVIALAESLSKALGSRARFITGGMHGVQELFAKHCEDDHRVFNLLPLGHASGYSAGSDIHTGGNLESRKTIFALMGDIYITAEGGPGVVQEASTAFSRGACVVPLIRTGGASSGMFGFPAKALERPPFASEELWELLKNKTATPLELASAVVKIVEGFLAVQEGSVIISPRIGKAGGAINIGQTEESAVRTVGITGVGRLEAESPDAKGAMRRRELSITAVGGEEAMRKLLSAYMVEGAPVHERIPDFSGDEIQEIWLNELNADTAIISALYNCRAQGGRTTPGIDCRQFKLEKYGSSWHVEKMLHPEFGTSLEKDFGSVMEQKQLQTKASSPKRRAPPPPLQELSIEEEVVPVAAPQGEADEATGTLVEAVRHGLEVIETSKTPRALFDGLATGSIGGSDPMVSREKFAHFVTMYGGRSPAASGGEKLSEELFEQLAITNDQTGEKGVPYDIFCTELCPERSPDALLRVKGKRSALLRDIQGALALPSGNSVCTLMLSGDEPLEERWYLAFLKRLLSPSGKVADTVAAKALWCELHRNNKRITQKEFLKVLKEAAPPATPARSPAACPGLDFRLLSDDATIEAAAARAAGDELEANKEADVEKLLQAMRLGVAIQHRAPRDLFDSVSTSPANYGAGSALTISEEDWLSFAARLSGANSMDKENERLCPHEAAAALFKELACLSDGTLGVHYEVFIAEVCPDSGPGSASEANAKVAKQRKALIRDLKTAVSSSSGLSALSRYGSQPMDEASFVKAVAEILGVPSHSLSVKLLWCSLVRGRHLLARVLSPRDFSSFLTSSDDLNSSRPLGRSTSLDLSDDGASASSLEMSDHSYPDMPIGTFSPFQTPSGAVKVRLKESLETSLGKENDLWEAVGSKLTDASPAKDDRSVEAKAAPQALSGGLVGTGYSSEAIRKRCEERKKMAEEAQQGQLSSASGIVPSLKLDLATGASAELKTPRSPGGTLLEQTPRSPGGSLLHLTPRRKSTSKRTLQLEECSAFKAEEVFTEEEAQEAIDTEFDAIMNKWSSRGKRASSLGQIDEKKEAEQRHPFRSPVAEGAHLLGEKSDRKSVGTPKSKASLAVSFAEEELSQKDENERSTVMNHPPTPAARGLPKELLDAEEGGESMSSATPEDAAVRALPAAAEVALWAEVQSLELCDKGEEQLFAGKAEMLDSLAAPSVSEAVAALNAGGLRGTEDCYVVFAAKHQAYFLIYQRGKRREALKRFDLVDPPNGKLVLSAITARGLPAASHGASSDHQAVVSVSLDKRTTEVDRQSTDPHWTKLTFEFQIDLASTDKRTLKLDVLRVGAEFVNSIGVAQVDAESLEPLVVSRRTLVLSLGGEVDIEVCYSPDDPVPAQSEPAAAAAEPKPLFDQLDTDGSGGISREELYKGVANGLVVEAKHAQRKHLSGISPLFRPKDFDALFNEVDADGDGVLGLDDLRAFCCDYLGYSQAEVAEFHRSCAQGSGVAKEVFKKEIRGALDPYRIHKQTDRLIMRKPGAFGGQDNIDLHIEDMTNCTVLICDSTQQAFVECCKGCTILIGPCVTTFKATECENCTFWVACRQFRTRECKNCAFYVYCNSEPCIESSEGLSFAPLTAEYPGLTRQFEIAKLDATRNFWKAIFDFSGKADRAHWSVRPLDDCETLVLSFEDGTSPDSPMPRVTQELLLATPPESSEGGVGESSKVNIPQTRPNPPPAPKRRHPETKELLGRPRRRTITDTATTSREGVLDIADADGNGNDDSIEEDIIVEDEELPRKDSRGRSPVAAKSGSALLRKGDDSDDDLPLHTRGLTALTESKRLMARAKATGTAALDSDDDDEPPLPKISPAAKKGLQALFKSAGNPMDDDSDDDSLANKLKPPAISKSLGSDSSDDERARRPASAAQASKPKRLTGKSSDSDSSDSVGGAAEKYMKWAKSAAKGSDDDESSDGEPRCMT